MNNKEIQEIALFKFSLIAPLVNNTYESESKMQYFREMASKTHVLPNGDTAKYSSYTIKSWYLKYNKLGIDGLMPKIRNDAGQPRSFNEETTKKIHAIKEQYPYITGKMVYQKLIEEGYIKASNVSVSSVYRYIKENNLKRNQLAPVERKAFEMEFANECWQSDTSHGPKIIIDGRKKQTYLISIIDDASRLVTHSQFYFNDNAVNMQTTLKKAILKYGVPKKLFVDNGSSYKNTQLSFICASLGILLIHTKPYSPQSKGKIERLFRTFKDNYINSIDWNKFKSLEHLNKEFNNYLKKDYQNKEHSAIQETPKNRYFKDIDKIKYKTEEDIESSFLHRVTRKVNNDSTIKLHTKYFEVPQKYIKQRINIRYSPIDIDTAYIYDKNNNQTEIIYPLDKIANSKIMRKAIDYREIDGGTINV